ncbi:MAG: cobyrinate a,c-diamide synthase [Hespellia sp.]|nr:cobyrinate a,c-diamide synthase [Hespellia sp.]
MKIPRLLITAGSSGSGKTLVTCGLLQLFKNRGLCTVAFKCGPDYIDPMFHESVLHTKSRNLDSFFMGEAGVRASLIKNVNSCDIAVLEGVMGYYDGLGGTSLRSSAYDVARLTKTPSILLVNTRGMSLSMIPLIQGFLHYQPDSHIRGVLLNQMSAMLYPRMKAVIEAECGVKVLGYLPKMADIHLESRHLGLLKPEEIVGLKEQVQKVAAVMEETLDFEGILQMAADAPELEENASLVNETDTKLPDQTVHIAVAKDEAFCFFYEDNLQILRELGAKLSFFSPIHDKGLPKGTQGILLCGGYPELYAKELSENRGMCGDIYQAVTEGIPCMAECGGFLYLQEALEDMNGISYPMANVIQARAYRTEKLSRFGYVTLKGGKTFGREVGPIPAHEFHYYDSTDCGSSFAAEKPVGNRKWNCIFSTDTLFAGFPHLHYMGNPEVPKAFLEKAGEIVREDRSNR